MPVSDEFLHYVLDQLDGLGCLTARRMFGGAGIYLDGFFFAVIADDTVYFKVDETNRPDYMAAGMGPFRPFENKPDVMQYYEVPIDVLEDRDELAVWARKACAVAQRAAVRKRKKKKGGTG